LKDGQDKKQSFGFQYSYSFPRSPTHPLSLSRGNTPPAPLKRGVSESPFYRGDLEVCLFNDEL